MLAHNLLFRLFSAATVVPVPGVVSAAPPSRTVSVSYTSRPAFPSKDPDDNFDYSVNWADLIDDENDMIASVLVTVDTGTVSIGKYGIVTDRQLTTAWISGGGNDETCLIRTRITTQKGRKADQTVTLPVAQR